MTFDIRTRVDSAVDRIPSGAARDTLAAALESPQPPSRISRFARRALALLAVVTLGGALAACDDDGGDGDGADAGGDADGASAPIEAPPVTVVNGPPLEEVAADDPELGTRTGSPLDDLPENVTTLTDFGTRPDWSPDGESLVFLDASPLGDVWTVDVASGEARELTADFDQQFSRAYYLSNGDLLLCGPTSGPQPSPEHPEAGRFTGVMSVLRAPFDGRPEPLGVPCWEGMATASTSMRVAWNRSDIDYTDPDATDRIVNGITEIWTGEIRDVGGRAELVGARKVLDRDSFGSFAVFEVQDFRGPDEGELIVTAYAYQNGEVLGLDLETGEVRNYSNSSAYEEAESVDPDGEYVLVERDLEYTGLPGALDVWRLGFDDGSWERVTYFNRWAPYYASNPAVSPDGSRLAFQLSIDGDVEGQGAGILLMELEPSG